MTEKPKNNSATNRAREAQDKEFKELVQGMSSDSREAFARAVIPDSD